MKALGKASKKADAEAEVKKLKLDRLYARSARCENVTTNESREFCRALADAQREETNAIEAERLSKIVDDAARELVTLGVGGQDSLAYRIAGYTRGAVTEEQVRLWQPLFIPVVGSLFAALFLTMGVRMDFHTSETEPKMPRPTLLGRIAGAFRRERKAPAPRVARVPPPMPTNVVKMQPKQKRAIDPKPLIAYMAQRVPEADGALAEWGDILKGFRRWHAVQDAGTEPYSAADFGLVLAAICEKADIRVLTKGERVFCVNRRVT